MHCFSEKGCSKFPKKVLISNGILSSDETYQSDTKAESELEQRYLNLDLTENQRMIINDYIACMRTANGRYSDLSYMADIKDTVTLFIYLGLLKNIEAVN